MLQNQNHLYAISENDGKIVFIEDVENGLRCGCICSKCKEPLVAKNKGKTDRIHHFAHKSDSKCSGETQALFFSKDIIEREMFLSVPSHKKWQKIKFDKVEVEKLIGDYDYRADLICLTHILVIFFVDLGLK